MGQQSQSANETNGSQDLGENVFCNPDNDVYAYPSTACTVFEAANSEGIALDLTQYGIKWFSDIVQYVIAGLLRTIEQFYITLGAFAFLTPDPPGFLTLGAPEEDSGLGVVQANASLHGPGPGLVAVAGIALLTLSIVLSNIAAILNIERYPDVSRQDWLRGMVLIPLWYVIGTTALDVVNLLEDQVFAVAYGSLARSAIVSQGQAAATTVVGSTSVTGGVSVGGNLAPIILLLFAVLSALSALLFFALMLLRYVLILIYFLFGPILIALRYSGLPWVSELGRRALWRFPILVFLTIPFGLFILGVQLFFVDIQLVDVLLKDLSNYTLHNTALMKAYIRLFVFMSIPVVGLYVSYGFFTQGAPMANRAIAVVGGTARAVGKKTVQGTKRVGKTGTKVAVAADGGGRHPLAHVRDQLRGRSQSPTWTWSTSRNPSNDCDHDQDSVATPTPPSPTADAPNDGGHLGYQSGPSQVWGQPRPDSSPKLIDPRFDRLSHVILKPHARIDADRSPATPDRSLPPDEPLTRDQGSDQSHLDLNVGVDGDVDASTSVSGDSTDGDGESNSEALIDTTGWTLSPVDGDATALTGKPQGSPQDDSRPTQNALSRPREQTKTSLHHTRPQPQPQGLLTQFQARLNEQATEFCRESKASVSRRRSAPEAGYDELDGRPVEFSPGAEPEPRAGTEAKSPLDHSEMATSTGPPSPTDHAPDQDSTATPETGAETQTPTPTPATEASVSDQPLVTDSESTDNTRMHDRTAPINYTAASEAKLDRETTRSPTENDK